MRFSAEQEPTDPGFAERARDILASHGQRSSSESGLPALIFAIFAWGCSASPSMKSTSRRLASAVPSVVLPLPLTPIITTGPKSTPHHFDDALTGLPAIP